jgi:predicted nuclease of predicted toxin-antitoxin system
VRLLLDAHISAQRVAVPLRDRGHDVRAVAEERKLDGTPDEELCALAAEEERVLVTCDVKDFPAITRRWAEAGRPHAGCAIVVGIDHGEFGAILQTIGAALTVHPQQNDWADLTLFLARTTSG